MKKRYYYRGKNHHSWNTEKHIKHYCKEIDCNNEIRYETFKYGQGRCMSCSKKGDKNPAKRPEVRRKISRKKNHNQEKNPNFRYYISKKELCNLYINEKLTARKIAIVFKCSCSTIYRKLKEFKIPRRNNNGENNGMFGKTPKYERIKYDNIWMRSSWEVNFAYFLDLSGYKWLYESRTFDLGNTTYTPDFYLPEWGLYIEIKGWFTDKAKKRIKKFGKLYPKIRIKVLMQKELREFGILRQIKKEKEELKCVILLVDKLIVNFQVVIIVDIVGNGFIMDTLIGVQTTGQQVIILN